MTPSQMRVFRQREGQLRQLLEVRRSKESPVLDLAILLLSAELKMMVAFAMGADAEREKGER